MLGAACRLCPPGTAALSAVSAPDLNAETSQHPQCECALRAALGLTTGSQGWCVRAEQVHFMMHHSEGAWSKVEQARLQWLQIIVHGLAKDDTTSQSMSLQGTRQYSPPTGLGQSR